MNKERTQLRGSLMAKSPTLHYMSIIEQMIEIKNHDTCEGVGVVATKFILTHTWKWNKNIKGDVATDHFNVYGDVVTDHFNIKGDVATNHFKKAILLGEVATDQYKV